MRGLFFVLLGGLILAGLFVLIPRDQPTDSKAMAPAAAPSQRAAVAQDGGSASPTTLAWEVRAGQVQVQPELPQVRQGDTVRIEVLSDAHDEVHLHGYDYTLNLQPGARGVLQFEAVHSGRFELELHHGHEVLGALTVLP